MIQNEIRNILDPYIIEGKKLSTKLTVGFWKKNYDIYKIYLYAEENNIEYNNFSELIYLIYHGIDKPNCYCGETIHKFKNFNLGYNKYCSRKCGNNDPVKIKDSLNKYKQTCKEKYGVDNVSKLDSIKKKKEDTTLKNYGVKYNSQRTEMKVILSDAIKSEDRQRKIHQTFLEKYNRISPVSEEITNKRINTCNLNKIDRINGYGKDHNFKVNSLIDNYTFSCLCNSCNKDFEIKYQLLHLRMKRDETVCTNCNKVYKPGSKGEKEIYDFIYDNYDGKIVIRDKSLGKELDIYLPEINLAVEFNGIYWHSELQKDKNYHLNKTNICNDNGIQLLHIFQDDWEYKQDILKSIILNKLNGSKKIYGRKCEIRIVNSKLSNEFLEENHIQGKCISQVNLGLYYNNELVSLMTFGSRNNQFELLRFCNLLNTTVIGGASKLFKYFVNNYEYDKIISYANLCISNGNLYYNLGFDYKKNTLPNYWWVIDGIKSHRLNWRKSELIKNGLLENNETEVDCMHRLGYYRIYDCGSMIFEYDQPSTGG